MKKSISTISKSALALGVLGVLAAATAALANPRPGFGCWRPGECLDVWLPVICSNGQIYSNDCYAWRSCATGCVPWGGDVSR